MLSLLRILARIFVLIVCGLYSLPSPAMDSEELQESIISVLNHSSLQEEAEFFQLEKGSVIVWGRSPTVNFYDLTDEKISENLSYEILSVAGFLNENTPLNFRGSDSPDIGIILSNDLTEMDVDEKTDVLVEKTGMSRFDAEQLANELGQDTSCFFKRYFTRDGVLDGAAIVIYPEVVQGSPPTPDSVLECAYDGLIAVSGFPRGRELVDLLGAQIGQFDAIGIRTLYECARSAGDGPRIASLSCVAEQVPEGIRIP